MDRLVDRGFDFSLLTPQRQPSHPVAGVFIDPREHSFLDEIIPRGVNSATEQT